MTATQIIAEIDALPAAEKLEVLRYTRQFTSEPRSPEILVKLAGALASESNPERIAILREEVAKGFYGAP